MAIPLIFVDQKENEGVGSEVSKQSYIELW
jgi:hypothetical protein